MAGDWFLGEIRLFPFDRIPRGWVACNGQTLPVNQMQALFALLGTTYGGDGRTNFGLPDLRGRTPYGTAATTQGARGGSETVTLTLPQLPPHTHNMLVNAQSGTKAPESGNFLAANAAGANPAAVPFNVYASQAGNPAVALHPSSVTSVGTNAGHENRQPSLAMSYCIATQGIFPSRP